MHGIILGAYRDARDSVFSYTLALKQHRAGTRATIAWKCLAALAGVWLTPCSGSQDKGGVRQAWRLHIVLVYRHARGYERRSLRHSD
jgi:hypothetical protein